MSFSATGLIGMTFPEPQRTLPGGERDFGSVHLMMLLDTDVLIELRRGGAQAERFLNELRDPVLTVPGIVAMEFVIGSRNQIELDKAAVLRSGTRRFHYCGAGIATRINTLQLQFEAFRLNSWFDGPCSLSEIGVNTQGLSRPFTTASA